MGTALQLRRGTTAQHSTFTGAQGEVTVDTTKKTAVVHDGQTPGGVPLATEAAVNARVRFDTDAQGLNATQKANARKNIGAVAEPAATGLLAKTGDGAINPVTLTAGTGISITNGDGVLGNPVINNTGVLTVNGQSGNVTIPAGVSSINGLTGDVTINTTIPPIGMQLFNASGTFTVPAGVTAVRVAVVGGGGGGGGGYGRSSYSYYGQGGAGGRGGYGTTVVSGLTPGQQIPVTVGGGGAGVAGGNGGTGGTSSFGAYVTATGGTGGASAQATSSGSVVGANGSNGTISPTPISYTAPFATQVGNGGGGSYSTTNAWVAGASGQAGSVTVEW